MNNHESMKNYEQPWRYEQQGSILKIHKNYVFDIEIFRTDIEIFLTDIQMINIKRMIETWNESFVSDGSYWTIQA